MLQLHAHPFASYCQKVLVALYENATPFEYVLVGDDAAWRRVEALWPIRHIPVLRDGEKTVFEATTIIEYLHVHAPGPVRLLQGDGIEIRMLDRFFDNYVMTPMQDIVGDYLRPAEHRDPYGVDRAHALLDKAYAWLELHLAGREWAADGFSLADCAAAPSLFYADWVHPIAPALGNLRAYRQRLLSRPSFARAVEEARPFRAYFPPGAPDRD